MESINQRPIPHITTWTLQNSFGITSTYILKSITNESQINVTVINGSVYIEYTPPSPVPIEKGDVIGIMMPVDENDRAQSVRPLFLSLSEGNSSTFSCVRLRDSQLISLQDRMCQNQLDQQSLYIPLVSAILNNGTSSTAAPSLTTVATSSSTQLATTMASTPPANPKTTPQDTATDSTTVDLPAPPQSGANSNQLVGVTIGAILAALSLVLIIVLAIFLVLLLTKRRGKKLYTVPVPPQPDNLFHMHTQKMDGQSIEVKNNEAYSLSTTQQILTEENVAYAPSSATSQIPTENNVAYDQAMPQILTEDNVAYGQAMLQILTEDNVAYGQAMPQILTEDNVQGR